MTMWAVIGGAGFIGSHLVHTLVEQGEEVVVVDNFSTGHRKHIPSEADLITGDYSKRDTLDVLLELRADVVVHLAGLTHVSESEEFPHLYLKENTIKSIKLIDTLASAERSPAFVFSSSAAVYGELIASHGPDFDELHPRNPISVYGLSKKMVEDVLEAYARTHAFRSVALRYFNAAGGWADKDLAERHAPETHLIPKAIDAAIGHSHILDIHNPNHIRDFIHVRDLANGHILAANYILEHGTSTPINLGSGKGTSVADVIAAVERHVGPVPWRPAPPRTGDPMTLVASTWFAERRLGFQPERSNIDTIVRDAIHSRTRET